jgi:methoxymalonate biosynthesis acyl carrier protein
MRQEQKQMTPEQIKETITAFLTRHVPMNGLSDDDSIFQTKAVNSLFAMQLVLFVEKEFGIQIENEDLELSNFESINALTRLVTKKTR